MDVILDVDPGVDDALAILLALASPELNVRALTVVCGNVPLERGIDNALRVLAFAGRDDVPVYAGADVPLSREPVHATEVHGESGLGHANLPPSSQKPRAGAAAFLDATLNAEPGEVTVVAVGPLTNLAAAERAFSGCLNRARKIVVMGGAVAEPGNASPCAEFNFFADPEAAKEVIAVANNLTIVPLDVTHQAGIGKAEIESSIRPMGTERSAFFCDATEVVVSHDTRAGGYPGVFLHDPAAVGYAINAELFQIKKMSVDVETEGELTSGQLVADRRVGAPGDGRTGCVQDVAMGVDAEGLLDLFRARVLDT
jgi:purine nucleosidase